MSFTIPFLYPTSCLKWSGRQWCIEENRMVGQVPTKLFSSRCHFLLLHSGHEVGWGPAATIALAHQQRKGEGKGEEMHAVPLQALDRLSWPWLLCLVHFLQQECLVCLAETLKMHCNFDWSVSMSKKLLMSIFHKLNFEKIFMLLLTMKQEGY